MILWLSSNIKSHVMGHTKRCSHSATSSEITGAGVETDIQVQELGSFCGLGRD